MPSLPLTPQERDVALDAFRTTRTGREKPSQYWKIDLESLAPNASADGAAGEVAIESVVAACDRLRFADRGARPRGAVCARVSPGDRTAAQVRAFGACQRTPRRVHLHACDCAIDEPIVVHYRAADGETIFPYTVVLAERGARATIVERLELGAGTFACGVAEVVTEEGSDVTYASAQFAPQDARVLFTRVARPGRDARVAWASAELGAALSISDLTITIAQPGVDAKIATLFFPTGSQHVDVVSTSITAAATQPPKRW